MPVKSEDTLTTLKMEHLKDYLQRNSSPTHKLSINEIAMGLTREMTGENYNMVYSASFVDSSLKVQLKRLLQDYGTKSHPFLKDSADIHIYCSEFDYSQNDGNMILPDADKKVFYARSVLNEESVAVLRDSLVVFPYAEPAVTKDIISRLNRMASKYNRVEYDPKRVSAVKFPGTYYENVSEIMKAFAKVEYDSDGDNYLDKKEKKMSSEEYEKLKRKKIKKISFEYYSYNEKKQLEIRKLKNGSTVRIVNPVKLLWANGYYYLVTAYLWKDKDSGTESFNYINYRVDKMKNVKCLDEDALIPENFSPEKYRNSHPVMYVGENEKNIEIRCKKYLINNAIDTFGFDIKISNDSDDDHVIIKLSDISPEGVKMWALEYGSGCEILSPYSLREDMRKAASHLLEVYSKAAEL